MDNLKTLGLSQGLLDHLAADDQADPLWYRCQPAHYWNSSPIAERGVVGLWESGTVLTYFSREKGRFEQCSLEEIDDIWHSYASLQGVLAVLFVTAHEDGMDDDALREHASRFDFRHAGRMLCEMPDRESDHGQWAEWARLFPGTCT